MNARIRQSLEAAERMQANQVVTSNPILMADVQTIVKCLRSHLGLDSDAVPYVEPPARPGKVILTRELIHAGAGGLPTGTGIPAAYTKRQVALFGVPWPLTKGWLFNLIGREVDESVYREFLALKKG